MVPFRVSTMKSPQSMSTILNLSTALPTSQRRQVTSRRPSIGTKAKRTAFRSPILKTDDNEEELKTISLTIGTRVPKTRLSTTVIIRSQPRRTPPSLSSFRLSVPINITEMGLSKLYHNRNRSRSSSVEKNHLSRVTSLLGAENRCLQGARHNTQAI